MKKYNFSIIIIFSFLLLSCGGCSKNSEEKEVKKYPVTLGDPFILLYENTYYAYGTSSDEGIEVYTSQDLKTWERSDKLALSKNDSYADRWFWAPEIYYIKDKNKFYMYYSADEHICVATADSPLGPFKQDEKKPMLPDKAIDNSLFIDDDGKPYLSFVRFTDGNEIWMAELEDDLMTIKESTMIPSLHVSEPWEEVWPRVNEGSFIVKHAAKYYMSYSANSFESPLYGVGYATADSPMGPWVKYDKNPILQKPEDLIGVGHSAMFTDKEGKMKIVFHAHNSNTNIHPRVMYIMDVTFTDDSVPVMKITGDIIRPQWISKI